MRVTLRQNLARSLARARVDIDRFETVSELLGLSCLTFADGRLLLDANVRDSAIAVGVYLHESGTQRHAKRLLEEMSKLLRQLPTAKWLTLPSEQNDYYLPLAEQFCFAFGALYSKVVAVRNQADEVAQLGQDMLDTLKHYLIVLRSFADSFSAQRLDGSQQPVVTSSDCLCKYVVPSMLGLLRSFARSLIDPRIVVSDLVLADCNSPLCTTAYSLSATDSNVVRTRRSDSTTSKRVANAIVINRRRPLRCDRVFLTDTDVAELLIVEPNEQTNEYCTLPFVFIQFDEKTVIQFFRLMQEVLDDTRICKAIEDSLEIFRSTLRDIPFPHKRFDVAQHLLTLVGSLVQHAQQATSGYGDLKEVGAYFEEFLEEALAQVYSSMMKVNSAYPSSRRSTHSVHGRRRGPYPPTLQNSILDTHCAVRRCAAAIKIVALTLNQRKRAGEFCLLLCEKLVRLLRRSGEASAVCNKWQQLSFLVKRSALLAHSQLLLTLLNILPELAVRFTELHPHVIDTLASFLLRPGEIIRHLLRKGLGNINYQPSLGSDSPERVVAVERGKHLLKVVDLLIDCAIRNMCRALNEADANTQSSSVHKLTGKASEILRDFRLGETSHIDRNDKNIRELLLLNSIQLLGSLPMRLPGDDSIQSTFHHCLSSDFTGQPETNAAGDVREELKLRILDQLVIVAVSAPKKFDETVLPLVSCFLECVESEDAPNNYDYRRRKLAVLSAFKTIARKVPTSFPSASPSAEVDDDFDHDLLAKFFVRMLELCRGLADRLNCLHTAQIEQERDNFESLVPIVAIAATRLPRIANPNVYLLKLYRDFWTLCALFDLANTQRSPEKSLIQQDLQLIAAKSPPLVNRDCGLPKEHKIVVSRRTLEQFCDTLRSRLCKLLTITGSDQYKPNGQSLSSRSSSALCNKPLSACDLAKASAQLDVVDLVFILVLCYVEHYRVLSPCNPVDGVFQTLECLLIQEEGHCKAAVTKLMVQLLMKAASSFIQSVGQSNKRSVERNQLIVDYAHSLLVLMVKTTHDRIRCRIDQCLVDVIQHFPFVLIDTSVLYSLVDIVSVLEIESRAQMPRKRSEYDLPASSRKLEVPPVTGLFDAFFARARCWIEDAIKWVPFTTYSALICRAMENPRASVTQPAKVGPHFFDVQRLITLSQGGVVLSDLAQQLYNLEASCLKKISYRVHAVRRKNASKRDSFQSRMSVTLETSQDKAVSSCYFQKVFQSRLFAHAQLSVMPTDDDACFVSVKKASTGPFNDDGKAAQFIDNFNSSMHRATALIANEPVGSARRHRLMRLLCFAPLHVLRISCFSLAVPFMEIAISCWRWMLTSRPDLHIALMGHVLDAWQSTVDQKLGVFLDQREAMREFDERSDPLTHSGAADCKLSQTIAFYHVHSVWAKFLEEYFQVARSTATDVIYLYAEFLVKSLRCSTTHHYFRLLPTSALLSRNFALSQGERMQNMCGGKISSHLSALDVRFRLLQLGFSLLHSALLPSSMCDLLRFTVYTNALEYFCAPPQYSIQHSSVLRQTIEVLQRFFESVRTDRRYILIRKGQAAEHVTKVSSLANLVGRRSDSFSEFALKYDSDFDYSKRRRLLIALLIDEIDRLATWYNPLNLADLQIGDVQAMSEKRVRLEQQLSADYVRLAWRIDPLLSFHLCERFSTANAVAQYCHLIREHALLVAHYPPALHRFDCGDYGDGFSVRALACLLSGSQVSAATAIGLLHPRITSPNFMLVQYACRVLQNCSSEILIFHTPQLVQALRYDAFGLVRELVVALAGRSQLFAHQLLWNMETNMYKYREKDSVVIVENPFADLLASIIEEIRRNLTSDARAYLTRQFQLIEELTAVSEKLKVLPPGDVRREACRRLVREVELRSAGYLPVKPEAFIVSLDPESARPMQSAAKAPYLVKFFIHECGCDEVERIGMQADANRMEANEQVDLTEQLVIFKVGDDVRQDVLALQLIGLMRNCIHLSGINLFLYPYRVVATGPGRGIIECVPNAKSCAEILTTTESSLPQYFSDKYGKVASASHQEALRAFVESVAAYSVACYLLQMKDRHNGNLVLDNLGHLIHIDFGFIFDSSPGNNFGFEGDIKMSSDMFTLLGGGVDSLMYKWFEILSVRTYLLIRRHRLALTGLVSAMLDTKLPCFVSGKSDVLLQQRFAHDVQRERAAAEHILWVLNKHLTMIRTNFYQYMQNMQKTQN